MEIEAFIRLLVLHAEIVPIVVFHFRHYPVDPDDFLQFRRHCQALGS